MEKSLVLGIWSGWNNSSMLLLPVSLWPRVIMPVWVPSIDQIDLFQYYLDMIRPYAKKKKKILKKQQYKNVNMNSFFKPLGLKYLKIDRHVKIN